MKCSPPRRRRRCRRRAIVIVSFVAALLVIGTLVLWVFQLTASSARASLGHYLSMGAFYAAEGGIEMSMREQNQTPPTDIDSDGTIGTISDNSQTSDDPALASGAFYVTKVGTGPDTFQAIGRPIETSAPWNTYSRVVEVQVEAQ